MVDIVQLTQGLISGGLLAGSYAVIALAVSLIWGIMKIVHIGHFSIMFLAAYATFWLYTLFGVDPFLSLAITVPAFFAISLLVYVATVRPIIRRGSDINLELVSLIVLFGLAVFLEGFMVTAWSANPRSTLVDLGTILVGPFYIPIITLLLFSVGLAVTVSMSVFLQNTWTGKGIRAVAQNGQAAAMVGVNVNYIFLVVFGIAGLLAALGGQMISVLFSFWPNGYFPWMVKAFMIVALGGVGSIKGTFVAAILLGFAEGITGLFLPFVYSQIIAVIILILIIYFRPGVGLFGKPI